ncbi:MAG: gephyrin-like molybdotransferase Glp [Anaerolineae bacterium]
MTLLSVHAAQAQMLSHFRPVETEILPLDRCAGRVLAANIIAADLPLFDNSSVDGFAVLASDVQDASQLKPSVLRVVADIPAGSSPTVSIQHGQAARIMTGAPLPDGADAVIMVEDTDFGTRGAGTLAPAQVKALKRVDAGENVRTRGMDAKRGEKVLFTGHRLRPQDLGMLAMLGVANVTVFRRPRAALLSSGDELSPVDQPLAPGKIRDTNSYTLGALIAETGSEVLSLGVAPDEREAIRFLFDQAVAMSADVIISSAGVSVGALDFVKEVVEAEGILEFWKVNMRPGKPLAFGSYRDIPFIGLPGNPVSAFVGFEVFVRPTLLRLAGLPEQEAAIRQHVRVQLAEAIESDGRESYLRAIVQERDGVMSARLTGHQGSGNLLSLVQANALLIIPAGVKSLAIGSQVDAWML